MSEHTEGAPRRVQPVDGLPADLRQNQAPIHGYSQRTVCGLLSPPVGSWKARAAWAAAMAHKSSVSRPGLAMMRRRPPAALPPPPSSSFPCARGRIRRGLQHASVPIDPILGILLASYGSPARQLQQRCMVGRNGNDGGTWPWMMGSAAAAFPDEMIELTERSSPCCSCWLIEASCENACDVIDKVRESTELLVVGGRALDRRTPPHNTPAAVTQPALPLSVSRSLSLSQAGGPACPLLSSVLFHSPCLHVDDRQNKFSRP